MGLRAVLAPRASLTTPRDYWYEPGIPACSVRQRASGVLTVVSGTGVTELELAARHDAQGSSEATWHYLSALEEMWPHLASCSAAGQRACPAWHAYHQGLARFLMCAQRYGQYVPGHGIVIHHGPEMRTVPIRLVGLPWTPNDIQQWNAVGAWQTSVVTRPVSRCGWGLPMVVSRTCPTGEHPADGFVQPGMSFAVTALLRVEGCGAGGPGEPECHDDESRTVIEFHNPLTMHDVDVEQTRRPLAADLSAPFAFRAICGGNKADPLAWFIHPEQANDSDGLFFLEPWQPGRIPVVLIHGLMSSPQTWVDLANELRSMPGFSDRFQIWGFRYATGSPFVASAALLRSELQSAICQLQSVGHDPALQHVVLVGHSMGGLIAKAQISCSHDHLWNAISDCPLSQIRTDPKTRHLLQERFFFSPQPAVRRVIFVAVPHGGSTLATRIVGQVGTCLVDRDAEVRQRHRQLVEDNPGVFSREVRHRLPTSIDLLESNSGLLQALHRCPVSQQVRMHSIIGNGRCTIGDGRGDGVVGVRSARHPGAASELYLPTTHTGIHRRRDTACEVWRILCEQYAEYQAESSDVPLPVVPPVPFDPRADGLSDDAATLDSSEFKKAAEPQSRIFVTGDESLYSPNS
jgi:hypothetical protein